MSGWQRIGIVVSVAWLVGLSTVQAPAQDQNAQILIQAARSLKFTEPGNKAFILEKQETVVAEVAVIFGYGDNRSAFISDFRHCRRDRDDSRTSLEIPACP